MTRPRKTQHNYHFLFSPAQGQLAADSHRLNLQHMPSSARKETGIVTRLCQEKDTRMARSQFGTRCIAARTASRRCATALPVQPTVSLRGVGVCSWPNRARCRQCGQGEREEIHFFETSLEKNFLRSGASASNCSASTSPASRSPKRPDAHRAKPISTSTERPRLHMKRSWSSWTNCGRASGRDRRAA